MSWRDAIAKRLMGQPLRTLHPNAIPDAQWKAQQWGEQALNKAQGDRAAAAAQQQQLLDYYRGVPSPELVNPRNINRAEDTLGVLRSNEPLDEWWKAAQ